MSISTSEAALILLMTMKDETGPGIAKAEGGLTKLQKATGLAKSAAGALSGVLATGLVASLADNARAAAEDEANVTKLRVAVENTGVAWDDNVSAIKDRIKVGQDLAFTDTDIRDSLAVLVTATGDVNKALELQHTAMDVARAKGTDLSTASLAVGKAAEGNATSLGKMLGIMDKNATAAELLAKVQERTAGQAEKYGDTTAASIFKVHDRIDEWRESIGAATGPAMGLIGLLPGLASGVEIVGGAFGAATPLLKDHIGELKNFAQVAGKGGLVLGAAALVVLALEQIGETVQLVRDHWDVFVYALRTGKLNDIPVFGFFFGQAQSLIALLERIKGLWDAVSSAFNGGASTMAPASADGTPIYNGPIVPYASGVDRMVGPGYGGAHVFVAGEGSQPERLTVTPAGSGGAGPEYVLLTTIVQINGREIARAMEVQKRGESRRFGTTLEPSPA